MLAIACDLCGNAITDKGWLIDVIEARMVMTSDARPRVTERGKITSVETCDRCGARVLQLIADIRRHRIEAA